MNLFDIFVATAEKQPSHPLIITHQATYTYGDFRERIEELMVELQAAGVRPKSCIGLHYPNSPEYISLTYAIWGCGACVVPIPTELSPDEKLQIFQHIRIDGLIANANMPAGLESLLSSTAITLSNKAVFAPTQLFRDHPAGFEEINAAFIRFSSGTTGAAKGVALSHETIFARIHAANEGLAIGPDDRIVWLLSMAYHFAVSIVAYLTFGATILLCPNAFGVTIIRVAAKHKATITYAAPTHYGLMAQDRSEELLPDLRLAIVTTTALPTEIAAAFYRRFRRALNETYGIIEIGLPCINLGKPLAKQGSVGQVLPNYALRIERMNANSSIGAIQLRGEGLVDAYYEPWQPRADILAQNEGWFATGDLGEVDEESYLFIRGRAKEVISVGGMKFFPQEVEAVLEAHPAIQEACVFRYPDQRLGDIPHAHLVCAVGCATVPTPEELNSYCVERLAIHKVPKQFDFVPALTRTASGKLIRDRTKLIPQGVINGDHSS